MSPPSFSDSDRFFSSTDQTINIIFHDQNDDDNDTVSFKSKLATATQTYPSPSPSSSPPPSPPHSFSGTNGSKVEKTMAPATTASLESIVLNSTNLYRELHQAEFLKWNETLAEYAQNWAEGCIWKHSNGPYGENLAANFPNPTLAIDAWASEEEVYNYAAKKFTHENGHFTQLVWRNTTDVGCAVVDCDSSDEEEQGDVQGAYLVCEYSPAGNVKGEFGWNVRKPGIGEDGSLGFGGAEGRMAGVRKRLWGLGIGYLLASTLI